MRNFFRSLWYIITIPFRLIRWIINKIYSWLYNIYRDIRSFFQDEPEDSPITDTLTKTVEEPEQLFVHLQDLRKHLLRAVIFLGITIAISFAFSNQILDFLSKPLEGGASSLVAIEVTEPISTLMRISLLTGFALALPYIVFELFRFVAPGVSVSARKWGLFFIPIVVLFFVGGMAFTFYVMLPQALPFLLNILDIQTQLRPSSYIKFVTNMMFWVGIAFEFPILIFALAGMGLVKADMLLQQWRLAVVIIAIVAALITPTIDPINMALVMAPLIALYFLSILLASIAQRRRTKFPS